MSNILPFRPKECCLTAKYCSNHYSEPQYVQYYIQDSTSALLVKCTSLSTPVAVWVKGAKGILVVK